MNWTARHRNAVALELAGYKNHEIAEILRWKPAKVSVTLNDDRAAIDRLEMAGRISDKLEDVHLKLNLLSHEAVQGVADLMRDSGNDGIKLKACFGILDRAGYSTLHRIQTEGGESIPHEMLDRISEVMEEISEHSKSYHTPEPAFEDIKEGEFEVVG